MSKAPLAGLALFFTAVLAGNALIAGCFSTDPNGAVLAFKFFILGTLLFLLPLRLAVFFKAGRDPVATYLGCSLGVWVFMAALGLSPLLRNGSLSNAGFGGIIILWVYCAADLAATLYGREGKVSLGTASFHISGVALVVLFSCSALWGISYTSPSIIERMALGAVHRDTYILSAVEMMIRDYGNVSVGINGLTKINYHFFSACVFAGVSKLTGAAAIQVYSLFYSQTIPALFIFSLTLFLWKLYPAAVRFQTWLAPVFLASMATYVLPRKYLDYFVAWDPLLSESYGVALTLLIHGFYFLPLRETEEENYPWPMAIFHSLWLFFLGLSKISVGATAGLCMTGLAYFRKEKLPSLALKMGVVWLGFFLINQIGVKRTNLAGNAFDFLYFVRKNAFGGWKGFPVFIIVHWLPVWIGLAALRLRAADNRAFLRGLLNDRYFVFVLSPACAVGFASFSLTLFAATSFSFSNFPTILALPWIGAMFFDSLGEAGSLKVRRYFFFLLVMAALCQWIPRAYATWDKVVLNHDPRSSPPEVQADLAVLLKTREALSTNPRCALHAAPEWLFKSHLGTYSQCWEVPYYFVGILERPLYLSWTRKECRESLVGRTYNHPAGPSPTPEMMTPQALCASARADGFTCVEVLSPQKLEKIGCP